MDGTVVRFSFQGQMVVSPSAKWIRRADEQGTRCVMGRRCPETGWEAKPSTPAATSQRSNGSSPAADDGPAADRRPWR